MTERIRGRKGQELRHRRLLRTNYLCEMCQVACPHRVVRFQS